MITPDRWQRIQQLFDEAMERPPEQRDGYLAHACAGDESLRAEVASLIEADSRDDELSERPFLGDGFKLPAPQALLSGAEDPLAGARIGPYRLERMLADGGMGTVYLACRDDGQFEQQVAIKLIRLSIESPDLLAGFVRERQLLAGLHHPNIARLLDGGTTENGRPYLVMEYVRGQPIDAFCERRGLTVEQRLGLFREVCAAIHYAHRNLVIHCDLKPANIMVTEDGTPKLLDFGIAQLLSTEHADEVPPQTTIPLSMMTPVYASPEQVRGEPVTTSTDVYSLGVVLYELLSGRRPFEIKTRLRYEIERIICEQEPPRPSLAAEGHKRRARLAGDLDTVVSTAMRKEPARRYSSAEQLSEDLRLHLEGLPISAREDTLGYRAGKFLLRHKAGVVAAALVMLSLIVGIAGTGWQAHTAAAQRDLADQQRRQAEANLVRALEAEQQCALEAVAANEYAETARNAAREAQAINAFLQTTLASVDPGNEGRDATVLQVLNKASNRAERELAGQPGVEAAVRHTIGKSYHALGDFDLAEGHLRASVSLYAGLAAKGIDTGPAHPRAVRDLAHLLRDRGRFEQAETLYRQALDRFRSLFGPIDPESAGTLADLATLLHEMGRYAEAEPLCAEAVRLHLNLLGDEHRRQPGLQVADSLNKLGSVLRYTGDWEAAEPLYRRALAIRRNLLRAEHPRIADTLHNLGLVLYHRGAPAQAESALREALDIRRHNLPPDHPSLAATMMTLGQVLIARGEIEELDEAEDLLRQCATIRRLALGEDHWMTAEAESILGECLTAQGRFEEAEPYLLRCYPKLQAECGPEHQRTFDALQRLEKLYDAWDKPAEADAYRAIIAGLNHSGRPAGP